MTPLVFFFFFFNDTATTEIYTLSLHDALPISGVIVCQVGEGSDELFCGYPYWKASLRLQRYSSSLPIPHALRNLGLASLAFVEGGPRASYRRPWSCELLRRALSNRPVFWGGAEVLSDSQKRQFLSP